MDDEAAFRRSRRRVWRFFVLATLLLPVVAGGYTIATWQPIYRAEHLLEESVNVPLIHALLLRSGIAFFVPLLVMLFIRLVRFALS